MSETAVLTQKAAVPTSDETPKYKPRSLKNRTFRRGHGVSESVLAELKARFPAWEFEFGNDAHHDHPIGATERAITEQLLYEEICRVNGVAVRITDVGGNANRHLKSGRTNVHSCNPVLSAADAVRRRTDKYQPGADYCTSRAEKCQLTPDVYLAVHSLYYIEPLTVLQLVHRARLGRLYAVVHSFKDLYGAFHVVNGTPESTYQTYLEGDYAMIHMKVKGNHTGYTHSACNWLHETNYLQAGGIAMAWTSRPVGCSNLYEFTIAPINLIEEQETHMSLCDSICRSDHYGPISGIMSHGDLSEFSPMLEKLHIKTARWMSFGNYTASFFAKKRTVLVPKDLIVSIGNSMVGMERNERTLTTCVNRMRVAVKKMNVPESMKSDCLTYGSALAFVYCLQDEIDAFNSLCRKSWRNKFSALASALSLTPTGCCARASAIDLDVDRARKEAGKTARNAYEADRATPAILQAFNAREAWPSGLPGVECSLPLQTIKAGARIKDRDIEEKVEFEPQLQVNCPVFTPIQAVVPNPSKNNELRALINRALVKTPAEDTELWKTVHSNAAILLKQMEPLEKPYDDLFMEWNNHYPPAVQVKNREAYARVRQNGISKNDLNMKMFIKREVTLKTGEAFEDFDPRAIQGCSDELNVAYGPFIWAASKRLGLQWGDQDRICYTSGMTAEQIGQWRASYDGNDSITIVELDESRYDAHQGHGTAECALLLKNACGMQRYHLPSSVEDEMFVKKGGSKYFKYRVPGTMTSGKADTSMSNTFVNGCKLDTLLQQFGFRKTEYRMLVNGDDSLVVINRELSAERQKYLKEFLVSRNLSLGFKTKCKVSTQWHDVEYCSGLFWPVEDGYVLGPKIGRRLPKLGFGVRKLNESEIKSMIEGMRKDLAHVPVLRVYYNACDKMARNLATKKTKTNVYLDKELKYKNLCKTTHTASTATEIFFEARYNISLRLCEESLADSLDGLKTITDCVHYPMMHAFEKDL